MVQYVITPWRDRRELLAVRAQFYPTISSTSNSSYHRSPSISSLSEQQLQDQHDAVSRVHMWTLRGGCPHLVESTALLTAAMLNEVEGELKGHGTRDFTLRLAYSTAFSRFVTGLLDSHQDRAYKMPMYGVAKSVGLPASFVELRHETTHEQLPSLNRLRAAADKARDWIWDHYWSNLPALEDTMGDELGTWVDADDGGCSEEVLRVLEIEEEGEAEAAMGEVLARYGEGVVLKVLSDVAEAMTDTKAGLKVTSMIRQVLGVEREDLNAEPRPDIEALRQELGEAWNRVREMDQLSALPGNPDGVAVKDTPSSSWTLSR